MKKETYDTLVAFLDGPESKAIELFDESYRDNIAYDKGCGCPSCMANFGALREFNKGTPIY